jgi:two-component system capsular synthesis sensor histidine kinase RcsC
VTDSPRGNLQTSECCFPSYNRRLLYAVALALSFAVLAVSATLAWDQMNLVIDNVQRRNYVEQLDTLKNNQRKFIYSLDQTARLHSRLLVEQPRSDVCDADIVFPGDLDISAGTDSGNLDTEPRIITTLGNRGCASRFHLLRRLAGSLAISIQNFWNYPEISSYTFDLKGNFLAQSHGFPRAAHAQDSTIHEQIAAATASLQPSVRRLYKTVQTPALPFFTGLHQRTSEKDQVLSIGVPIYRKDKLFAITAIDIEHRAFSRVFMQDGRLPGFFVFDTSHTAPVLLNNIGIDERPLVQSVVKHWRSINMTAHDMTATKIGHRFYLAETIAGTPWVAIYSFSFSDIFLVSESLWMWIGFSMFGALLLLWSGIYLINRYMLVPLGLAAQRIAASEEFNRTILATAPVGLCMLDLQTAQILLANDLARSYVSRWGKQPGLGRHILDAYTGITIDSAAAKPERSLLYTELPVPENIDAPPLLAAFSQVRYHNREVLLCGLSDIAKHKEAEAILQQARQSADEANAAKSIFLATISHEIRTPLHGAMGNLELLENTPLSASQHNTIGTINRAFFSLLQIINNVLDLSKIGANQLQLSNDAFNPVSLLEDVARTFAPCIAKKQVQFIFLLDSGLPERMLGDEPRLRQIFNNLLSNAVKFTASGKIIMRADLLELTDGDCSFTVQLIDSGIGISAHNQQKLFMPFQQANNAIADTFGGTGLGLSLARNLCEAMGGAIKVESSEGQGACFTVSLTLPVLPVQPISDTSEAENFAGSASRANPMTPALTDVVIVLCCDDAVWRQHLRGQLEASGATVLIVTADSPVSLSTSLLTTQMPCDTFLIACQESQEALYLPRLAQYPQARHVVMTPLGPLPPEQHADCIRVSALSQQGLLSAVDPAFKATPARRHATVELAPVSAAINTSRVVNAANIAITPLPATAATTATPLKILLVDDDLVNVALAQQQLAILGYHQIDFAGNGLTALEKCDEQIYQLVLTDQFMPEMDGNMLAATLRKKAYPARIVMITASRPNPADRQNLDAVLLKPVSLEQLRGVLSSHCSPSAPIAALSGQVILWNAFLQDYADTMDTLELAVRTGERAKCIRQLHKLKGALGILRQPLVKRIATLERRSKTAPLKELMQAYRTLRQALDRLIAERTHA